MTTSQQELIVGSENTPDTPESSGSKEMTPAETTVEYSLDHENMELIKAGKSVRVPKNPNFSRRDVVNAFQQAFELIGGVPRLALWAHEHETEFYKLHARLLPSQSSSALGESNQLNITINTPRSPLDDEC